MRTIWILNKFWLIFNFPLIVLLIFIIYISYFGQKVVLKFFGLGKILKIFWKLDIFLLKEIKFLQEDFILSNFPTNIDKTTKEKLMKAVNPKKDHEYVCKQELKLDKDKQTVFMVKYLTSDQGAEIRDDTYQVGGVGNKRKEKFLTGTSEIKCLKFGLVGWRNFKDDDGSDITFNKANIGDCLDMIPPNIRTELANHIRGESELDEGEG